MSEWYRKFAGWSVPVWVIVIDAMVARDSFWRGFLVEWASILIVCGLAALIRRDRIGWGLYGLVVAVFVICAATGGQNNVTNMKLFAFAALLAAWYGLLLLPRRRPAVVAAEAMGEVSHVYHHVIHHGPDGVALPAPAATEKRVLTPAQYRELESPKRGSAVRTRIRTLIDQR